MKSGKSKKKFTKKKLSISSNFVWSLLFLIAILSNTYVHLNHDIKRFYRDKIDSLNRDLNTFKKSVYLDIVKEIITLTNLFHQTSHPILNGVSLPQIEYIEDIQVTDTLSITNIPAFVFDSVCSVNGDYIALFNGYQYRVGDKLHGFRIVDISPFFVNVAGRYFPVGREEKKSSIQPIQKIQAPKIGVKKNDT